MVSFIAGRIEKDAKVSIEKGQAKYRAYFVKTKIYIALYKDDVDAILIQDGFEDVIVS